MKRRRKLTGWLLTLATVLSMLAVMPITASADNIQYMYASYRIYYNYKESFRSYADNQRIWLPSGSVVSIPNNTYYYTDYAINGNSFSIGLRYSGSPSPDAWVYTVVQGTLPAGKTLSNQCSSIAAEGVAYFSAEYVNIDYSITMETYGGTINSGAVTSYTIEDSVTLPTDVTKENCSFGGWYDNPSFTGEPVESFDAGQMGDKTYYAKWIPVYTVTLTGGANATPDYATTQVVSVGDAMQTVVYKPVEGYYFAPYAGENQNGVTAALVESDIRVSGTPTDDVSITIPDAVEKLTPDATAPTAAAFYGQRLADAALTNPVGNTEGTWAWADGSTLLGTVGAQTYKATFTPTDTTTYKTVENVDVTVTVSANDPFFATQNIALSSDLRVSFFMDLSALTPEQREASYMTFTVSGKDGQVNERVNFNAEKMNQSGLYYGFTCNVNVIQMADTITAVYHYNDGTDKTEGKTYSVKEYLDTVAAEAGFSDEMKALGEAMSDYGYYAQQYLSNLRGFTLGNEADHAAMPVRGAYTEEQIAAAKTAVSGYNLSADRDISGIASVNYSLLLDTETGIFIYLTPVSYDGDVTASCGGNALDAARLNDGRYKIHISGIKTGQLGAEYAVNVTMGEDTFTLTLSALSYANAMLNGGAAANELRDNALTALYRYYDAAMTYAGRPH